VTEVEEKVKQIQANILVVQSCQKSYAEKRRNPLEFEVGDNVYLRVSPMKGVCRFGIKGKLAPRYNGSYPIIDKYGPTSYQVELHFVCVFISWSVAHTKSSIINFCLEYLLAFNLYSSNK
jgi:hypothetical protein